MQDLIKGFWSTSFTAVHDVIATVLNECVEVGDVPGWVVERRTILAMKDSLKGTEVGNYRPIACLNLILKPLKRIIIDKTYDHLEENRLLPEEQKQVEDSAKGRKINF